MLFIQISSVNQSDENPQMSGILILLKLHENFPSHFLTQFEYTFLEERKSIYEEKGVFLDNIPCSYQQLQDTYS